MDSFLCVCMIYYGVDVLSVSGIVRSNYIVDIFQSSDIFVFFFIAPCPTHRRGNVAHKGHPHTGNFVEGADIRSPPPPE